MKTGLKYFLILFVISNCNINAQTLNDALNYTDDFIQGTARFNSMSGAFGALGGDLSSMSANPAGSAIFNNGNFSISFGSDNKSNDVSLFDASRNTDKRNFTLNQIGGVITFENLDRGNNWNKISLGITYNQTKNNFNEYSISNISNINSIDLTLISIRNFSFFSKIS